MDSGCYACKAHSVLKKLRLRSLSTHLAAPDPASLDLGEDEHRARPGGRHRRLFCTGILHTYVYTYYIYTYVCAYIYIDIGVYIDIWVYI